jgi:hypothetical protein
MKYNGLMGFFKDYFMAPKQVPPSNSAPVRPHPEPPRAPPCPPPTPSAQWSCSACTFLNQARTRPARSHDPHGVARTRPVLDPYSTRTRPDPYSTCDVPPLHLKFVVICFKSFVSPHHMHIESVSKKSNSNHLHFVLRAATLSARSATRQHRLHRRATSHCGRQWERACRPLLARTGPTPHAGPATH